MSNTKSQALKEKLVGLFFCFIQLLLTIVLLSLLLIFKHFTIPYFILLAFALLVCFVFTFLSQQSRNHRLMGRYIAIGSDMLLLASCILCFIV